MKKLTKIIGAAAGVALAAGLVPTHVTKDKETGEFEIGGLLWNLKKAPGEEEDTYTMKLLPFIDPEDEPAAEVEADAEDKPVEEPFSEEASNEVVVETAEEPDETAKAEADPDLKVEITVDLTDDEASAPPEKDAE